MTQKISFLLTIILLFITPLLYGQKTEKISDVSEITSAEDMRVFLGKNTKYPMECLRNNIFGDVVLSFTVNKQARLDRATIVISPNQDLSVSVLNSMNVMENIWHPFKDSIILANKEYLIAFRYRIYQDVEPPDYAQQATKSVAKQKFEKALKLYDKAIEDNIYDGKLLAARSEIKMLLNDEKGAELDRQNAERLLNELLTVINIEAIGKTRSVSR